MSATIFIADKYRGPPNSGNGGYVAGMVADVFTGGDHTLPNFGAVEVTLRAPTPLNQALAADREGDTLKVSSAGALIAEARVTTLQLRVPKPPSWREALDVRDQSYSFPVGLNALFATPLRGVHPICFCCGAELSAEKGTHVYSAPLAERDLAVAAWSPHDWLANERGEIRPEFVWTALDCPGQMAWRVRGIHTGMLGRLTARIDKQVRAGERCIVIGWPMQNEGKKYFAGTALFNEAGELCAYAQAVWIGRFN